MPFQPDMTPIIAVSSMTRTRPDGVQEPITVEFGAPELVPEEVGIPGYYATLRIRGIQQDEKVFCVYGGDSAQALSLALCTPGVFLPALPFADEIDFSELPHFGFPVMPLSLQQHAARTRDN